MNAGVRILLFIFITFSFLFFTKRNVFEPLRVSGVSMEDTLYSKDLIFSDKTVPLFGTIQRGRVYIFKDSLRGHFIKRCIALSGDTLQIINGEVFINNTIQPPFETVKMAYLIRLSGSKGFYNYLKSAGVTNTIRRHTFENEFTGELNQLEKSKIERYPKCVHITNIPSEIPYFTNNSLASSIGAIVIPKKGLTLPLNEEYRKVISEDSEAEVTQVNGVYYLGGKVCSHYTFKHHYVFVMGDNREHSTDSRTFGFVKIETITGEAKVWISIKNSKFTIRLI